MKKTAIALLHKPVLVTIVSLLIAGAIGIAAIQGGSAIRASEVNVDAGGGTAPDAGARAGHLSLGFLTSGRIKTVSVKVGDEVQKGDILASLEPENTAGALTQAKAALASAEAAYQKALNGATGPEIDVAKAAVSAAENNLASIRRQQDALVDNARRKLYSDGLVAISYDKDRRAVVPTISGTYNGTDSGEYEIFFDDFNDYNAMQVTFSGLEKGTAMGRDVPQPFGTRGLMIAFPDVDYKIEDQWTVEIPNTSGANYTANLNAYQAAVQTRDQSVAAAEAALEQAQAALALKAAATRPEDVAAAAAQVESARGALQMAQAAYDSRIIRAPEAGVVTAVHISAGQIAAPNAPAIELSITPRQSN